LRVGRLGIHFGYISPNALISLLPVRRATGVWEGDPMMPFLCCRYAHTMVQPFEKKLEKEKF
jgi:hypothetical protein